jgi:isopenicillin N synthase-like dioxygenase|tara:strand:+ start:1361 stop:2338 length:978 start_codon:yes stop_codon:yes gene_type:complete
MINEDYIPKIDLSNLIAHGVNSPEAQNTIQKIKKASEEVGFFTVTNHGVSSQSIDKITTTARSFFHLPLDKKLTIAPKKWNKNTDTVYRGYFPSEVNGKEGLDIGDPLLTHDMTDLTQKEKFEVNHNMSAIDHNWQNTINNYYDQVFGLGIHLFKALISCFSSNIELADFAFQRPKTLSTLRFNYYPNQEKPVEISSQDGVALGCETHVDSGIMTILYQDKKGGLQVQNRHNLQWYDVPHDPQSYVVNSGLALQYLTNGHFKATNHRVLFNKEERISIPFFFEPSYDFDINPKHIGIVDTPLYEVDSYENFLTNSLKKFVEYDRP